MATSPCIIAHRGASGYLPEHTLPAKVLAHAQGADYLEQDVVLTGDGVPIVLHDIYLDTVTDVATLFPGRCRPDGRYYAIDFQWQEVRQLQVHERTDRHTGAVVYSGRFPHGASRFTVATLAEEIELIQGLNRTTGRDVGLYPEIKAPAFHRQAGWDISRQVLDVLWTYGYRHRDDNIFVQCFDAAETRRLREELGTELSLVQLIGENDWAESATDYDVLRTSAGLQDVARYAQAIGPHIPQIFVGFDVHGRPVLTELVRQAHAVGLAVHAYTVRRDELPPGVADADTLLRVLWEDAGVEGVFTDFPDHAVQLRARRQQGARRHQGARPCE